MTFHRRLAGRLTPLKTPHRPRRLCERCRCAEWYRERDLLTFITETAIPESSSADETVERIPLELKARAEVGWC